MPHELIVRAWSFYRSTLQGSIQAIRVARRGRRAVSSAGAPPSRVHGQCMTITIDDIDVLIRHHLFTGFFMLGELVGMEVEGLAMGSPMGSALTRMALIFCDLTFYYSLHGPELPPLGYRGRVYETVILGHMVWLLEVRYMDDYLLLWKGPSYLNARDIGLLSSRLARRAGERYPLPLERDDSLTF
eukprot:8235811-Pyramimonas_sp.AAC.1